MRTAFEPEGDVRSVDLPAAFASLWRERASGVLRFSRARQSVRFEILDADVVGVFSSDAEFETAEVLIRAGKLDAAALEDQRIPEGVDRAGAARQLGLLTERDWRWGEKIRMVEILADVTGWLDGSYEFDRAAIPDEPEPGEFRLGVQRLLLELFLRSHDRAFVHHALGAPDAPLHRAEDFDESFATLGLTPEAAPVIAAIDGRATAADISRRMPPDPFSVEKLLAALATLGLVHPEYAAETPPAIKRGRVAPVPFPAQPPPAPPPPVQPPPAPPVPSPSVQFDAVEALPPEPPVPVSEPPAAPEPAPVPDASIPAPGPRRRRDVEPEIELPLAPPHLPSEPEPMVTDWEQSAPGPLDQPLGLPEPPEMLRPSRSSRPGLSLSSVWLLVLLAAGVGALLLFRSRSPEEPGTATSVTSPTAPAAVSPGAPERSVSPAPGAAVPPLAVVDPTGTPSPAPGVAVATPPPPPPSPPPPLATTAAAGAAAPTVAPVPSPLLPSPAAAASPSAPAPAPAGRAGWLARAREDRRRVEADPGARFTIQLELVCELPSVEEAWAYDRGGEMWLAAASHKGRPCFRVFWGRYATLDEARLAKETVPRFFFTPTNHPVVVATERALLP